MSVVLGITIEKSAGALSRDGRKIMRRVAKENLKECAGHWHEALLENHFKSSNTSRYRMEPLSEVYRKYIKTRRGTGRGKYVPIILSGKSRRFLMAFATISGTGRQATVKMKSPTYFTSPFVGTFLDPRSGNMKHVSQQPDKPGEITQVDSRDRADLRKFAEKNAAKKFASPDYNPSKTIRFGGS